MDSKCGACGRPTAEKLKPLANQSVCPECWTTFQEATAALLDRALEEAVNLSIEEAA